jgi:hypothetical protein
MKFMNFGSEANGGSEVKKKSQGVTVSFAPPALPALPDTPEVQELFRKEGEGSSLTGFDIAMLILKRLEDLVDDMLYPGEIQFLRDCLHGGHDVTKLICTVPDDCAKSEGSAASHDVEMTALQQA